MSTSVAACAVLLPLAWGSWTAFHYTEQRRAQFAPWRALIPEQAETIWPGTPVGAWYLLERPSYYSHHQIAGDIFSRQKTVEIRRRGHLIQAALRTADPAPQPAPQSASVASASKVELPRNADGLDQRGLAAVCEDPALGFVVSWKSLGPTPFEPITPFGARPGSQLHLYRCADVLSMQSPSRSAALRH